MTSRFIDSFQFGRYVIFRPFKGFYELKYEKKGTLRAGLTYLLILYLTQIFRSLTTGYIFNAAKGSPINFIMILIQVAAPYLLFCISSWCLTLLFDGEGTMRQIGMGLCYSCIPLIFSNIIVSILSNFFLYDEGMYLSLIDSICTIWSVFLLFISVMQINQYSFIRTILSCIATIAGIAVILFIILLCFNLIQQMIAFLESIYKEFIYRV